MKNAFSIAIVIVALACSTKEKHQGEQANEWKELDSFHKIMAEAFHPLKDSGNLGPAKKLAGDLAAEAERWAAAALPEQVNNDEMKSNLETLKTDSRSFADEIAKGASDEVLKQKLTSLHDQFHKIMEASGGHHEEGEKHDRDHDDEDDDDD